MTSALREHWKANDGAYPQRFELLQSTYDAFVTDRRLVNTSMNFLENLQRKGWEDEFLGVPIAVSADGNAMVSANGDRVILAS